MTKLDMLRGSQITDAGKLEEEAKSSFARTATLLDSIPLWGLNTNDSNRWFSTDIGTRVVGEMTVEFRDLPGGGAQKMHRKVEEA